MQPSTSECKVGAGETAYAWLTVTATHAVTFEAAKPTGARDCRSDGRESVAWLEGAQRAACPT
jgi:hypothetical protein